jgi:predicted RNA-binding Zn ribbon-like protein
MPLERLTSWSQFMCWADEQGLILAAQRASLMDLDLPMTSVLGARELIFKVGLALADGNGPTPKDLSRLVILASSPWPKPVWEGGRLRWRMRSSSAADELIGLIARDALDLISSDRANRVGICQSEDCGWLFIDESRGRPRRWCSMKGCGNREKVRAAYLRSSKMR